MVNSTINQVFCSKNNAVSCETAKNNFCCFVSGIGQFHTAEPGKAYARPYLSISMSEIASLGVNPPNVPKAAAQWFIPSTLPRRNAEAQRTNGSFYALWCDIDTTNGLTFRELINLAGQVLGDVAMIGYTTRSATESNQKTRIIFPLAAPVHGAEYATYAGILNDRLESVGITPDRATERPAQICYLPNRGEFYDYLIVERNPLDVLQSFAAEVAEKAIAAQAAQEALQAAQAATLSRTVARAETGVESPIDAFNAHERLEGLLAGYGYKKIGDRWLSPLSESGAPGVVVIDGRWISHHSSDASIGVWDGVVSSGDAFDLFVHFEHGDDRNAAIKAAGDMYTTDDGLTINEANRRKFFSQSVAAKQISQSVDAEQTTNHAPEQPEPVHVTREEHAALLKSFMANPPLTGHHLWRATLGSGKTRALAALKVKAVVATPTVEQGRQTAEDLRAAGIKARFFAGRNAADTNEHRATDSSNDCGRMCYRGQESDELQNAGLARHHQNLLCGDKQDPDFMKCPHYAQCGYNRQFHIHDDIQIAVVSHDILFDESKLLSFLKKTLSPEVFIIDEAPQRITKISKHSVGGIDLSSAAGRIVRQCAVEQSAPENLEDAKRIIDAELQQIEFSLPDVHPIKSPQENIAAIKRYMAEGKVRPIPYSVLRGTQRYLGGEKNCIWYTPPLTKIDAMVRVASIKKLQVENAIWLDATAQPELIEAVTGEQPVLHDYAVAQNAVITQVTGLTFSHTWLADTDNLQRVEMFLEQAGVDAVILPKAAEEKLKYLPQTPTKIGHFGNVRGSNEFKDCESLAVIGRPEPEAVIVESLSRCYWPKESLTFTGKYIRNADGSTYHADPKINSILRSIRESEVTQAVGRARAVWSDTTKKIIVFGRYVPPGMPIDNQIKYSDILPPERLAKVWYLLGGVLPLSATDIHAIEPDLYKTEAAAKEDLKVFKGGFLLNTILSRKPPLKSHSYRIDGKSGHNKTLLSRCNLSVDAILEKLNKLAVSFIEPTCLAKEKITAAAASIFDLGAAIAAPITASVDYVAEVATAAAVTGIFDLGAAICAPLTATADYVSPLVATNAVIPDPPQGANLRVIGASRLTGEQRSAVAARKMEILEMLEGR